MEIAKRQRVLHDAILEVMGNPATMLAVCERVCKSIKADLREQGAIKLLLATASQANEFGSSEEYRCHPLRVHPFGAHKNSSSGVIVLAGHPDNPSPSARCFLHSVVATLSSVCQNHPQYVGVIRAEISPRGHRRTMRFFEVGFERATYLAGGFIEGDYSDQVIGSELWSVVRFLSGLYNLRISTKRSPLAHFENFKEFLPKARAVPTETA